jgi:Fe-S-cluster containining protein
MIHTKTPLLQIEEMGCTQGSTTTHGELTELLESLRREVTEGFLDSHNRTHKNAGKMLEIASFCYSLIELLQEKGLITLEELNERKKVVGNRLVKKFAEQEIGVVALQEYNQDKYTFKEEVQIDCASRLHLCRAACCRLDLALSRQDIEEGILKWDLGDPYMIAKDAEGYCRHLDRTTRRCSVWKHRPIPCRGYDCRKDERIWLDFEKEMINPNLEDLMGQRDRMNTQRGRN